MCVRVFVRRGTMECTLPLRYYFPQLSRPAQRLPTQPRPTSHYTTLRTTPGIPIPSVHLHLVLRMMRRAGGGPWPASGHVAIVPPDLAHDVVEGVVHVDARLSRGLNEFAAELCRERLTLYMLPKGGRVVSEAREKRLVKGCREVGGCGGQVRKRVCSRCTLGA